MEVLRSRRELDRLQRWRDGSSPLVLVPTMGALHAGHLSLVRQARDLGPVVVTIFVNPTQFGPGEDYAAYPRELDRDLALLEPLDVAAVFTPPVTEMFPDRPRVMITPGPAGQDLCGAARPGHFSGVLTVVAKLLNLVRPQIAVFGRKDAQQCLVIAEMVADLDIPVHLLDLPTVREPDGLAMSSRNAYLSPEARERARCLSVALTTAHEALQAGERSPDSLRGTMRNALTPADRVEYAEVRRVPDLSVPASADGHLLLAVAARFDATRLIDNLVLQIDGDEVREAPLLSGRKADR